MTHQLRTCHVTNSTNQIRWKAQYLQWYFYLVRLHNLIDIANMVYFVLNAMPTTAHHNQFMTELGKKYTILFFIWQ